MLFIQPQGYWLIAMSIELLATDPDVDCNSDILLFSAGQIKSMPQGLCLSRRSTAGQDCDC
jgi:hypothetical protein